MLLPNPTISELLSDWQQWPVTQAPQLIKKFNQGLNHRTYLIKSAETLFVLKYFASPQENAIEQQKQAFQLGIAPRIVFNSQDHQLVLMDYIAPHKQNKFGDDIAIAQSLHRLHSNQRSSKQLPSNNTPTEQAFDLLGACDLYLVSCNDHIHNTHQQLKPTLMHFLNDGTAHCQCHNDLVIDNCLHDGEKALFIDWEYASTNSPWFDLASTIIYQNFDHLQTKRFLNAYHQNSRAMVNTPIFYSSQITVLWIDILWHLSKFGNQCWPKLNHKFVRLTKLANSLGIELNNPIQRGQY